MGVNSTKNSACDTCACIELFGKIKKGVGSFYTVIEQNTGIAYICKARGKFRNDRITPLIGDNVRFELEDDSSGYVLEILPRKNKLARPPVANIDILVVVLSSSIPKPDLLLFDKIAAVCYSENIEPILAINKCDSPDHEIITQIKADYSNSGIRSCYVSALNGNGVTELSNMLKGATACFAGQSAVGKSSLINALLPGFSLGVGEISHRTEHGKHTTRHTELWQLENGGMILDTPGFSLFETTEFSKILPMDLCKFYPEMVQSLNQCRFAGCAHNHEPDCAIKALLTTGKLSAGRYKRYLLIFNELMQKYNDRYN